MVFCFTPFPFRATLKDQILWQKNIVFATHHSFPKVQCQKFTWKRWKCENRHWLHWRTTSLQLLLLQQEKKLLQSQCQGSCSELIAFSKSAFYRYIFFSWELTSDSYLSLASSSVSKWFWSSAREACSSSIFDCCSSVTASSWFLSLVS